MPNTERLAQLQRIAYGAGTSDDERAAAVDESPHPARLPTTM